MSVARKSEVTHVLRISVFAVVLLLTSCGVVAAARPAPTPATHSLCSPGPTASAGIDETVNPDEYAEEAMALLTGFDEREVPLENEGDEVLYEAPNFGGITFGPDAELIVAVVDCSLVDADQIARIAGGPNNVRLIQVTYSYEEIIEFRDLLSSELRTSGVDGHVNVDGTPTGHYLRVVVEDRSELAADFGSGAPEGLWTIEEGSLFTAEPLTLD